MKSKIWNNITVGIVLIILIILLFNLKCWSKFNNDTILISIKLSASNYPSVMIL